MTEEILKTIKNIEQENNVKILYACESGSRAWGFASPDSDYDVRFIYIRPLDQYLTVFDDQRDVIELPIDDLLDVNGWDFKKSLNLLHKNNFALFEWLHSPVVYMDLGISTRLQKLVKESFRHDRGHYHYLAMSKGIYDQHIKDRETPGIKKLFYVLRTLCCCLWIEKYKTMPPVEFSELLKEKFLPEEIVTEINLLREEKKVKNEKDPAENCSRTVKYIAKELIRLEKLQPPMVQIDRDKVDGTFREILNEYNF